MLDIKTLVGQLSGFKPGKPLLKHIGRIRFPNFKNIEPDSEITFDFPLTVLVGANGSGKSSVLHALYGAPEKQSIRDFWFSTELDPIKEGKGLGVSRFIYSHWNDSINEYVETRKARVRSGAKLDYWEPTKIVVGDRMKPLGAAAGTKGAASDRWLPVDRKVVHINFKSEISAFDRFFYFETGQTKEEKHAAMLREARRLKWVIDNSKTSCVLWGRERVFENRPLTAAELASVKYILGHEYLAATIVRHTLYPGYRGQDISVLFQKPSMSYSEAFAGSGEVAVVSSVLKILSADDGALVLLDEPETSLHPGAQRRFLAFLLDRIKVAKIQVVISTHSPEFVHGLPDSAIKVLAETPTGKVAVGNSSSSLVAFKRIGAKVGGKVRVIVEDDLALKVVDLARRQLPDGEQEVFDFVVVAGGASMIFTHYIPSAIAAKDDTYVLLDGDQRFAKPLPDLETVAPADEPGLGDRILESVGAVPALYLSGGDDLNLCEKKIAAQKAYISWIDSRVSFLPRVVPEEIVIHAAFPDVIDCLDGTAETAKKVLYEKICAYSPAAKASQIIDIAAYELAIKHTTTPDIGEIVVILNGILADWKNSHA